jgi:hypothetical protein
VFVVLFYNLLSHLQVQDQALVQAQAAKEYQVDHRLQLHHHLVVLFLDPAVQEGQVDHQLQLHHRQVDLRPDPAVQEFQVDHRNQVQAQLKAAAEFQVALQVSFDSKRKIISILKFRADQ